MCVHRSTKTKTDGKGQKEEECHVSRVTCNLLTATATDPPPANSPAMHSMLVCKDPKSQKILKAKNH